MKPHPRTQVRRPRSPSTKQIAIAYAPDSEVASWIEHELVGERASLQLARAIREVVAALIEDPPPRPQMSIIDFDTLTPAQVLDLHRIREQGWFGSIIALGEVSDDLRASLNIDQVIPRPFRTDVLRKAVRALGLMRPTTKMTRL